MSFKMSENMISSKPVKVSVLCLAYNHEKYIRQCLDGFVMQKTDFSFEVLINDDASTDGTADILREYEHKYPDIFRIVYQKENQFVKGIDFFRRILGPMVRGQYVAVCEGDDYWTDPLKLQKQADYLDSHPSYGMCFTRSLRHFDDNSKPDSYFPFEGYNDQIIKESYTFAELVKYGNFMDTATVMYRWRFHEDPLSYIPEQVLPGDYFWHLLHAQKGDIGFINEPTAVYRRNSGSIWFNFLSDEWYNRYFKKHFHFYEEMARFFNVDTEKNKYYLVKGAIMSAARQQDYGFLDKLKNDYAAYFNEGVREINSASYYKFVLAALLKNIPLRDMKNCWGREYRRQKIFLSAKKFVKRILN